VTIDGREETKGGTNGRTPPVAIVGVSALFPGAEDAAAFWRDILEGRDRLSDVPRTHWLSGDYFDPKPGTPDKVCTTRGGFLPAIDFSPLEFGLPPNIAQATDTAQLLSLIVAKRALNEATRGRFESIDRSRMSVVLGVASATELVAHMSGRLQIPVAERAMRAAGLDEDEVTRVRQVLERCYVPWQESTFPGLLGNVVAGRIANRIDLGGTNAVVDAACASSLAAIDIGVNELALGRSDLVLTGGVDTLNDILMFMCFGQTGALSLTGDCRPFSEDADGTMLGEGIGIVALKRLADAERDGDPIYAVIRGIGTSSDGRAKSIYAPAPEGQARALERAYDRAGYGPDTVELVEAHGTATKAGDAAEVEALKKVFGAAGARPQSCALGSVKAQIGHTKAAAGAAGLIKIVMALHHRVLPGTFKVRAPNASFAGDVNPFYLNTEARPWIRSAESTTPRRASVSALGFGGTNFHVAVEEYRGPSPKPARLRACPTELVVFCGSDPRALADYCRMQSSKLEPTAARRALVHLARRSQESFDSRAPARLAIVAADDAELAQKLVAAAELLDRSDGTSFSTPRGIHFGAGPAAGPVAFVLPGQGSPYVGVG
jgi:acyl transferase domain-containing protein